MKYGINLYLWADDMHDGLMPVLERLKLPTRAIERVVSLIANRKPPR